MSGHADPLPDEAVGLLCHSQMSLTVGERSAILRSSRRCSSSTSSACDIVRGGHFRRRHIVLSRNPVSHSLHLAQRAPQTGDKTGGAQRRSSQDQRRPTGSGDRLRGLRSRALAKLRGSKGDPEIVAHTACTKRPRGPALASCQRPRPPLAPRRPHRRRASARKSHRNESSVCARRGALGDRI